MAQKPCILTGDRPYFFSQPIINGKGLDFAGDLRYAFPVHMRNKTEKLRYFNTVIQIKTGKFIPIELQEKCFIF